MDCIALEEKETMRKTKGKACYGTVEGLSYAFRVDGVDGEEFFGLPPERRMEATNRLLAFQFRAKHVGYSEVSQKAVKEWVKGIQPSQFFAFWRSGRVYHHDDYIEIFYTKQEEEEEEQK